MAHDYKKWPVSTIVDGIPDIENVTQALNNTAYGKCVYESNNDVCDNQIVNIEFSNGATCSFTMVAFTSQVGERQTRMHFTNGEIIGDFQRYQVADFRKGQYGRHRQLGGAERDEGIEIVEPKEDADVPKDGHGGGDTLLMQEFVRAVEEGRQDVLGTDIGDCLRSAITVFAAERSRKEGMVVDVQEFEREIREKLQTR